MVLSSSLTQEGLRVEFMVKLEHHGHDCLAVGSDPPTAGPGDFGNETSDMKTFEETRDSSALASGFTDAVGGREQVRADILVAEALDHVLTTHDGGEQATVSIRCGIEASVRAIMVPNGFHEKVQLPVRDGWVIDHGEGIEVAAIGGPGDLGVAVEICHTFSHGEPSHHALSFPYAPATDHEFIRMVDDCLHSQHTTDLVVHLDPILLHPVFDTSARPALCEAADDLAGETAVQFSSEEGHDILGAEAEGGVLQQIFIQRFQHLPAGEHDVGGVLGLVSNPVVLHATQQTFHQGIGLAGKAGEEAGPGEFLKTVGQPLCAGGVIDPDERVRNTLVGDVVRIHLSGQPVVTVQADLDSEGKPGLKTDVHESENGIDEIEVEAETFSRSIDYGWAVLPIDELETLAAFEDGEDADQPGGDSVLAGDCSRQFFFPDWSGEIPVGTVGFRGHVLGVLFQAGGMFRDEAFEVSEEESLSGEKVLHAFGVTDRQVSFEKNSVKGRQNAGDFGRMFLDEVVHVSVPPFLMHTG